MNVRENLLVLLGLVVVVSLGLAACGSKDVIDQTKVNTMLVDIEKSIQEYDVSFRGVRQFIRQLEITRVHDTAWAERTRSINPMEIYLKSPDESFFERAVKLNQQRSQTMIFELREEGEEFASLYFQLVVKALVVTNSVDSAEVFPEFYALAQQVNSGQHDGVQEFNRYLKSRYFNQTRDTLDRCSKEMITSLTTQSEILKQVASFYRSEDFITTRNLGPDFISTVGKTADDLGEAYVQWEAVKLRCVISLELLASNP